MAPRSLRPQLNQIRAWVRQGRTDAWIAHQLEVSVKDLRQFKRDHELEAPDSGESEGSAALDDDLDLRAEDDALVAAALDAESDDDDDDEDDDDEGEGGEDKPKRRRGRRGGGGRRRGGGGRGGGGGLSPPAGGVRAAVVSGAAASSRGPSTTARMATGSGWTRRSRTIPSTPSTGPGTGR